MNLPLTARGVARVAKSMFVGEHNFSVKWARRFVKRHKSDLRLRLPKQLTKGRTEKPQILEDCRAFAHTFEAYLEQMGTPPARCVFNCDESILVLQRDKLHVMRVSSASVDRPGLKSPRGNTIGSILAFINAAGECPLYVLVLKARVGENGNAQVREVPVPIKMLQEGYSRMTIGFSRSGFMNADLFREAVTAFGLVWRSHNDSDDTGKPRLRALLFADQLGVHHRAQTLEKGFEHNVWLWPLPRNSSHIVQALDAAPFALFKAKLREKADDYMFDKTFISMDFSPRIELIKAALDAFKQSFTRAVIISGFETTGLWPFEERSFVAHVSKCLDVEHTGEQRNLLADVARDLAKIHEESTKRVVERDESFEVLNEGGPVVEVDAAMLLRPTQLLKRIHKNNEEREERAMLVQRRKDAGEARKRQREADKKANKRMRMIRGELCRCRFDEGKDEQCTRVQKKEGSVGWISCSECKVWRICPKHATKDARALLKEHVEGCSGECPDVPVSFSSSSEEEDVPVDVDGQGPGVYLSSASTSSDIAAYDD